MDKTDTKKRIGILGGSFNPAHEGHIYISMQAIEKLDLSEVWWMVNPCNPFKEGQYMMLFSDRIKQASELVKGYPIKVTAIEADFNTRETFDTLTKLGEKVDLKNFVWLMGDDLLPDFPRWGNWKEIANIIDIAVFRRDFSVSELEKLESVKYLKKAGKWNYFDIEPNPMSSTKIRSGEICDALFINQAKKWRNR